MANVNKVIGGLRGMAAGGDSIKPTPRHKGLGAAADVVNFLHRAASKPFGYNNPPVELLSELLGVPAVGRTLDRMSYGEPLTNYGKANKPLLPDDIADATMSVAPLVGPLSKMATKGAKVVGKGALDLSKSDAAYNLAQKAFASPMMAAARPMGVVKEPGGNWLGGAGSPEFALAEMKPRITTARLAQYGPEHEGYVAAQTATGVPARNEALSNWVDKNLTNYVKKQMGTVDDPVRKLAEEGISHLPEGTPGSRYPERVWRHREAAGFPKSYGTSHKARVWEELADERIGSSRAGELAKPLTESERSRGFKSVVDYNPWLTKLDPEAKIHHLSDTSRALKQDLGFDHIFDVLKEDVVAGRIRPEQLSKVSMEQAVRRTHEYDQEMAKKMREAQIKATEGMPVHKEYPGGYKWIELKSGDDAKTTADALKYEGDTMGHCVGNYCPDVMEGKSRIYSLRDAKGEPHVTVEVKPQTDAGWGDFKKAGSDALSAQEEAKQRMGSNYENLAAHYVRGMSPEERTKANDELSRHMTDIYKERHGELPKSIQQIKGKQNREPHEQYLPYVQDFVRSGKWSDVGDLKNAKLYRKGDFIDEATPDQLDAIGMGEYLTADDIKKMRQGKPPQAPRFIDTDPEMDLDINFPDRANGEPRMADGGKIAGGLRKALEAATAPRRTLTPAEARQLIPGPKASIKPVLSAEEREAGLQKFLEPSTEKGRFYHGSKRADLKQIKTGKQMQEDKGKNLDIEPWAVDNRGASFVSPSPEFANDFAVGPSGLGGYGPTMYPVRVQVTNPWDYENPKHLKAATDKYLEMFPMDYDESNKFKYITNQLGKVSASNWGNIENAKMQAVIEALGHDAFYVKEAGVKNLGIYDPRKIKSDTGNKGYYDVTKPDLNEAQGGVIHMADAGRVVGGLSKALAAARKAEERPLKGNLIEKILEAQQPPMTTPMGTGLPLMPRDQGMYTPRQQKELPRMVEVDKARAANKSPKYNERMQDLLDSPTARKKVDKLIDKGQALNIKEWYGTEPLRQVAMDLGRTPEQFESMLAQLASASQRNPVDKQNQMGSYLYHLSETGQLPENSLLLTNKLKKALQEDPSLAEGRQLVELPQGYGSLAQGDIFNRAVMIGQGNIGKALPPEKKLGTFYENLLGNLKPVTVDVNALRGPIIERGDPRWLTSKLVEKDDTGKVINTYKPREMYASGELSMREARQRPGFWEAAPSGSEYAGFEDLWTRGAKRHGVEPAEAQALGWYGSGVAGEGQHVTALKTKPELYVDNLERLIKKTAEQTGKSPTEVMNDMITGQGFLRKDGGAVTDPHKSFEEHRIRTGHEWVGKEVKKADGGLAFKTLDFKSAGGMAGKAEIPVDPDIQAPEKTSSNMDIIKRLFGMGKDQAKEEIESLKKPRAGTDLLNRGIIANLAGAPVDLMNYMGLGSIDALTSLQGNKTKLMQDKPAGGSEYIKDLMDKYGATTGTERPMMELAGAFAGNLPYKAVSGAAKAAQKVGEKAPEYAKKAESGLKSLTSNVARPFTPGTSVIEAVAPDLATFRPKDFQNMVTERLIGDNGPLPLDYIGGKKTTKRSAQGVYGNDAGQLETNPMVAVDIPGIGAFNKNPAFRSDIASAGKALNQEAMAVHRFVPMFPNNIKDASAMLIKPKGGKLTNEEVIALGERLRNMVVAHNPRLGGVVVYPFDEVKKGVIPSEFLDAQSVANSVLGKRADIKYGVADYKKDRMFITRGEYADEGAREPSAQILAERKRLKKQEARAFPSPKPSSGLGQMQQLGTSTTR